MGATKIKHKKITAIPIASATALAVTMLAVASGALFLPKFWHKGAAVREVYIPPGATFPRIVKLLDDSDLLHGKRSFWLAAKLLRKADKLQAGKYSITTGLSNYVIIDILAKGRVTAAWVTIPEGTNRYGIASLLSRAVALDSALFIQLTHDPLYISRVDSSAPSLEGYLFPETYRLYWGITPQQVIETMFNEFHERITDSVRNRAADLKMSLHEIITLASIIEGEAQVDSERALISAVYHNRLQKNMLLQACPTVQYLLPGPPRRLLNRDLEIDSPYNTYLYPGLPPGPVNNPGAASIKAALYPAPVDYLYFVATGNGSHLFSRTVQEHNRAKQAFEKIRKEEDRRSR